MNRIFIAGTLYLFILSFYLYFLIFNFYFSRHESSSEQEEKEYPLSLPVQNYTRMDSTGLLLLILFYSFVCFVKSLFPFRDSNLITIPRNLITIPSTICLFHKSAQRVFNEKSCSCFTGSVLAS